MEVKGHEISEGLQNQLKYLGVSVAIVLLAVAGSNMVTSDEPIEVGYTEITTECVGFEAGVCLGLEKRDHTTYNYDNYTQPEEGTENYYRRVESELMIQAYNICNEDISGMEWTDEASYDNQTATEWLENDNIDLLPCEQTFYRSME